MRKFALFLLFCGAGLAADQNLLRIIPTPTLSNQGELRFMSASNATTAKYFGISAPAAMTATVKISLPDNIPNVGDCMTAGAIAGGVYPFAFGACGTGASLPFSDLTPLLKNDADPTRLLRIAVGGVSAATTRVWTARDADITVAGAEIDNLFTATQTFHDLHCYTDNGCNIGATGTAFNTLVTHNIDAAPTFDATSYTLVRHLAIADFLNGGAGIGGSSSYWDFLVNAKFSPATSSMFIRDNAGADVMDLVRIEGGVTWDEARFDMNIVPLASNWSIGTPTKPWNHGYFTFLHATTVMTNLIPTSIPVVPPGNGHLGLGDSSNRWNGFFQDVNIAGTCTGSGCAAGLLTTNNTWTGTNTWSNNATFNGAFSVMNFDGVFHQDLYSEHRLDFGTTLTQGGITIINTSRDGSLHDLTLSGNLSGVNALMSGNVEAFGTGNSQYVKANKLVFNYAGGAANFQWTMGGTNLAYLLDNSGASILQFDTASSPSAITVTANLDPAASDTYSIGSASNNEWLKVWAGQIELSNVIAIIPHTSHTQDVGSSGNIFSRIFVDSVLGKTWNGHLRPAADNVSEIGSPSLRWSNGYFTTITVGSCTGCANTLLASNNTWTGTNTWSNNATFDGAFSVTNFDAVFHQDLYSEHRIDFGTTLTQGGVTVIDASRNASINNASINNLTLGGVIVGDVGINTTNFTNLHAPPGGNGIAIRGLTDRGNIDFQSAKSPDADLDNIGAFTWTDIHNTAATGDNRIALIRARLDGSTGGNRGGRFAFFTRPDAGTTVLERFNIDRQGTASFAGNIVPYVDITTDLGQAPLRFRKLYVKDIAVSGTCTGCSNSSSVLTTQQFGAFCNGSSHPLSATYGTGAGALALAQAAFPYVVNVNVSNAPLALTDETDWAAIQNAVGYAKMATVSPGATILVQNGICFVNKTIDIGDGTSTSNSTYQGVTLAGQGSGKTRPGERSAATIIQWTGATSTSAVLVRVNGPIGGVYFRSMLLDCDNKCGVNIEDLHGFNGGATDIILHKPALWALSLQAYQNFPTGPGNNGNTWDHVVIKSVDTCTAGGVNLGNSSVSGGGILNVADNEFYDLAITGNPLTCPSGAGTAVQLNFTDSEAFYNLHTLYMSKSVVVKPPTGSSLFPQQVSFYNSYLGVTPTLDTSLNSWTPTVNNSGLLFENYVQDGGFPAFPTFAGVRGTTNAQWVYGQKYFTALGTNNAGLNTSALILQNYTLGANGSAIEWRATDTVTGNSSPWPSTPNNLFSVGRMLGVFDSNTYARARLSLQTFDGTNFNNILNVVGFKVGIGITNPAFPLDVVGTTNSTGLQSQALLLTTPTGTGPNTAPTAQILGDLNDAQWVATSFNGVPAVVGRYAEGSASSPGQIPINRQLFAVGARGYVPPFAGGSGFTTSASAVMQFFSGEAWTGSANGSYMVFATTPSNGSTTARSNKLVINGALDYQTLQTPGGLYASLYLTTDQFLITRGFASAPGAVPGGGYGGFTYKAGSQYWYYNGSTWQTFDFSAGGGASLLASANTWTAVNTFSANIVANGAIGMSGGNLTGIGTVSASFGTITNDLATGTLSVSTPCPGACSTAPTSISISNGLITQSGTAGGGSNTFTRVLVAPGFTTSGLVSTASVFLNGSTINDTYYSRQGNKGIDQILAVRNSTNTGSCTMTFQSGILTASSC